MFRRLKKRMDQMQLEYREEYERIVKSARRGSLNNNTLAAMTELKIRMKEIEYGFKALELYEKVELFNWKVDTENTEINDQKE